MEWIDTKNGQEECRDDGGQVIARLRSEGDKFRLWAYNKWGQLVGNTLHTSTGGAKGWVAANREELAKRDTEWKG